MEADGKLDVPVSLSVYPRSIRFLLTPSVRTWSLLLLGFDFHPVITCNVIVLNDAYLSSVRCEFGAKMLNYVCGKGHCLMSFVAIGEWIISSLVSCRRRGV